MKASRCAPVDSTASLFDFVSQEKQEEGVKNQFVTSIADAKDRMKKSREVLGQDHAEVMPYDMILVLCQRRYA